MGRVVNFFYPSEDAIQEAVLEHWRTFGIAGSLVAAIPNKKAFGQAGLTPGLPDLLVLSPLLGAVTGFIELKKERGRLSGRQIAVRDLMRENGIPYRTTYGRDEPIEVLEHWGAVKPQQGAA